MHRMCSLSCMLYCWRFFPSFTFNLCAGLDEEGEGANAAHSTLASHKHLEKHYNCFWPCYMLNIH